MINMVGCLEPMVNFLWRNDVRISRFFIRNYHARGRMIPALEPSVHGAMDGFSNTCNKITQAVSMNPLSKCTKKDHFSYT